MSSSIHDIAAFLASDPVALAETMRLVVGKMQNCGTVGISPGVSKAGALCDIGIAAGKDSSTPKEDPMYKWVSKQPYRHHKKWRVWYRGIDGQKCHETFGTEAEARVFVEKANTRLLVGRGHSIGDLVTTYLESRRQMLRPSSQKTLGFRLQAISKGRDAVPVEAFPWVRAWSENVGKQSTDSQVGILAAIKGFVAWCRVGGLLKRDPLAEVEAKGRKKRGKKQLHIDEARRFIDMALKLPDDPIALACAAMVYTGLRPGEIMGLQVRDLDADGTVLWVERSKTDAGKRTVEVAEVFQPFLQSLAKGRQSGQYLFDFKPERSRACQDERKQRVDALLRKTRSLCKEAGLPVVCSHSMRGLHSTLAAGFGATGHDVAKALGHTSFNVTKRHYVNGEVLANANLRGNLQILQGGQKAVTSLQKPVTAQEKAA